MAEKQQREGYSLGNCIFSLIQVCFPSGKAKEVLRNHCFKVLQVPQEGGTQAKPSGTVASWQVVKAYRTLPQQQKPLQVFPRMLEVLQGFGNG